jgi:hypothetical protein
MYIFYAKKVGENMVPTEIKKTEDEFISKLTASGIKYSLKETLDIGNNIKIYSIRPDYDSYFYPDKTTKKSICLHFTVGNIKSDISSLSKKDNHVSVSYVVDRSGRIYELFPDTNWSYHLGSNAIGKNEVMSKQSIGIEISNYGPLTLSGEELLDAYNKIYCKLSESEYYYKHPYKGHDYYASMTDIQTEAVAALVKYLGRKHNIPMNFKGDDEPFASASAAVSFNGIFYHTNVRKDKFDWPFGPALKGIIAACNDDLPNKVESKPDATKTASVKVETTPEVKLETPPPEQVQPEPQPEKQPEAQPEAKPEQKTEPTPAPKPEQKTEPKPKTATIQTNQTTGKSKSIIQTIIDFFLQLFGKKK